MAGVAVDNHGRLKHRLLPLFLIVALCSVGYISQQTEYTRPDGSTSTVALIQGNIEQNLKWKEEQIIPTIQKYYEQISKTSADIVILPETALPLMRQDLPEGILEQFAEQAQSNGSALAIGISQYRPTATATKMPSQFERLSQQHFRYHPLLRQEPPGSIRRIQAIAHHYRAPL